MSGLNSTPSSERIHIGIFGRRNAGKSSLINAVTGQSLAIVANVAGTTTDPVSKSMELLPLGPVVLTDTPGLDDKGILGQLRVEKALQVLNKTDLAILVIDASAGMNDDDRRILEQIYKKSIPHIIVMNKSDLVSEIPAVIPDDTIWVSTLTRYHIFDLKEKMGACMNSHGTSAQLVSDLISPGDLVVLVTPIDSSAPKGRLILPQQQTIRNILDAHALAVVVQDTELADTLTALKKRPRLVITDSQVFQKAAADTPEDIPLTSFSILFARYKGDLDTVSDGAFRIDSLKDDDHVLIAEGCTHHRQCGDIGTEKLPRLLQKYTGKALKFSFTSGTDFPEDLSRYSLVIHCGGCMLNEREMKYRLRQSQDQSIPITNYGIAIAHINGVLKRSLEVFS